MLTSIFGVAYKILATLFALARAPFVDHQVPLRIRIVKVLTRAIVDPYCHMHPPAENFRRDRFERLLEYTPEMRTIAAKDDDKCMCRDVSISDCVSVRIFRAKKGQGKQGGGEGADQQPPTILYYIHGGGFTLFHKSSAQYHHLCRRFALSGPFVVVSVEYRLAPEHRFPSAIVDTHFGLAWCAHGDHPLLDECGKPGQRRLVVAGDSAGGNMAAVLSMLARDSLDGYLQPGPKINIDHALLVYPSIHMMDAPSRTTLAHAYVIPKTTINFFTHAYLGNHEESLGHDIRVAPHRAATLSNLPPTTIIVATLDPLVDDGREYARMLRESGVACELREYNSVHNFYVMHNMKEAKEAQQFSVDVLLRK